MFESESDFMIWKFVSINFSEQLEISSRNVNPKCTIQAVVGMSLQIIFDSGQYIIFEYIFCRTVFVFEGQVVFRIVHSV